MAKSSKRKTDRSASESSYESPAGRTGSGAGSGREGSPASWSASMGGNRGESSRTKQGGQTRQSKSAARNAASRPTREELSGRGRGESERKRSTAGRASDNRASTNKRGSSQRSSSNRSSSGRTTTGRASSRRGENEGGPGRYERGGRPMESVYGGRGYGDESDRGGRRVVDRDDRDWERSARFDEGRSIRGERGELGWRSEGQRYADEGREHHPRRSGERDERGGWQDDRHAGFRREDREEGWQQSEEFGFAGEGPRARERSGEFYRPPAGRDDGRWSGSGRYTDAQGGYYSGRERDDRRGFDERYDRGDDRRGGESWSERGPRETQGYGHRADDFGGGDRGSQDFYRGRGARGEFDARRGEGPSRREYSRRSSRSGGRYD